MAKTYVTRNSVVSLTCPATGEAAPTTDGTEGIALDGLVAITVELAAESTRTLSATGSLACYYYDAATGGIGGTWRRRKEFDIDLTVKGVASQRYNSLATFEVIAPRGARVMWLPVTVGISAGTNVVVYMLGQVKGGVY